jgi:hypothetical protein
MGLIELLILLIIAAIVGFIAHSLLGYREAGSWSPLRSASSGRCLGPGLPNAWACRRSSPSG